MPSENQSSWSSFLLCCSSDHDYDQSYHRRSKDSVVYIQPGQFTHLSAERLIQEARHGTGRGSPEKGPIWGRSWFSPTSPRRLQISAPMNFRHIESNSFMMVPAPSDSTRGGLRLHKSIHPGLRTHLEEPEEEEREETQHQRQQKTGLDLSGKFFGPHNGMAAELEANELPSSLQPSVQPSLQPFGLELKGISPLSTYFDSTFGRITPPPPVHLLGTDREISSLTDWSNRSPTLRQQRSFSSLSFHVPRGKHSRDASSVSAVMNGPITSPIAAADMAVGILPPVPAKPRVRTSTASELDRIVERIAGALIESERIQQQIDSVVERQSVYLGSGSIYLGSGSGSGRPATAHGSAMLQGMGMGMSSQFSTPAAVQRSMSYRSSPRQSSPFGLPLSSHPPSRLPLHLRGTSRKSHHQPSHLCQPCQHSSFQAPPPGSPPSQPLPPPPHPHHHQLNASQMHFHPSDLTPMHSIPAVPAAAPSFAQRLSTAAGTPPVYGNSQPAPSQAQIITAAPRPLSQSSHTDIRHVQDLQQQQQPQIQQQEPVAQSPQQSFESSESSVLSPPPQRDLSSSQLAPMAEEILLAAAAFQRSSPSSSSTPQQSYGQADAAAQNLYEDAALFDKLAELEDHPLPPPLPLVLRPPLRKKKSFSRVSTWLFPDTAPAPAPAYAQTQAMAGRSSSSLSSTAVGSGNGSVSIGSSKALAIKNMMITAAGSAVPARAAAAEFFGVATTEPRPIKESDGFYQVVVAEEEEETAGAPPADVVLSPARASVGAAADVLEETRNHHLVADRSYGEDGVGEENDDDEDNCDDDGDLTDSDDDDDSRTKVGDSEFDYTATVGEATATTLWSATSSPTLHKQQQQRRQQEEEEEEEEPSPILSPPMVFADAVSKPTTVMVVGKSAAAVASIAERRFTTAVAVESPRMGGVAAAAADRKSLMVEQGPNGHRPTSVGVAY